MASDKMMKVPSWQSLLVSLPVGDEEAEARTVQPLDTSMRPLPAKLRAEKGAGGVNC